jgi:hypothetical protein
MASESHPLACKPIYVWSGDLLLSVTSYVFPSQIVRKNEDDIEPLGFCIGRLAIGHFGHKHGERDGCGEAQELDRGTSFSHSTSLQKNTNSFSTSIANRTSVHEKFCPTVSSGVYLIFIIRPELFWIRFHFGI